MSAACFPENQGFGALIQGCAVCDGPPLKGLHCPGCSVTHYCSPSHLASHTTKHRPACSAVAVARAVLSAEEAKLRAATSPRDPFTALHGRFWTVPATRAFMLARMDLVKTLRRLRTRDSVREQLRHVRAMLDLSVGDEVMARIAAPALLLRVGEDEACYALVRRWRATGRVWGHLRDGGDGGDVADRSVLEKNELDLDVFEGVEWMCDHEPGLNDGTVLEHAVAIALLKIKLIVDISMLQKAALFDKTDTARKLPQEVLDHIRRYIPRSSAVLHRRAIVERKDYSGLIMDLKGQIDNLYLAVKRMSHRFWPVMLDHYDHFEGRFRVHDRIGAAECPGGLRNSYDSWIETPGALDYLRAKVRGDPTSLKFIYLYG